LIDDEVPKSFALFIGHVCGVVAVGMVALSVFAIWSFYLKPSGQLFIASVVVIGLSGLFWRWAGALTGFWDTQGRLAVPRLVYSGLGAVLVAAIALRVAFAFVSPPTSVGEGSLFLIGVSCCAVFVYLCYLAYNRFG
jgi:hypothetical protein